MKSILSKILPFSWMAVWLTLPFNLKANALSLVIFSLLSLLSTTYFKPRFNRTQFGQFGLFLLFFGWFSFSLFLHPGDFSLIKVLEKKASFLFIPLMFILINGIPIETEKWAIRGLLSGLVISGLHMLFMAIIRLIEGNSIESVVYHEFTKPYQVGAIYYSMLVSATLLYLLFRSPENFIEKFKTPLIVFLTVLLFFCASKLFVLFMTPVLLFIFLQKIRTKKRTTRIYMTLLVLAGIILGTLPFMNRLSELKSTNIEIIRQSEYAYNSDFNGLTFRLIQWKLGFEIVNRQNAWWVGTGPGNTQNYLNKSYLNHGIYSGNPELGDTGYLNYNFHNQYLETLVSTGIPGLFLLLLIIISIFVINKSKLIFPVGVYLLVLLFFLTESVLERQVGIIFFCLLWCFPQNTNSTQISTNGSRINQQH